MKGSLEVQRKIAQEKQSPLKFILSGWEDNWKEGFLRVRLEAGFPSLQLSLPDTSVIPKRSKIHKDWLLRQAKLTEEIKSFRAQLKGSRQR